MAICTACKGQVATGSPFCPTCGRKLRWPTGTLRAHVKAPASATKQRGVGCIVLLVISMVIGGVIAVTSNHKSGSNATGVSSDVWTYEAQKLGGYANDYSVAVAAGNFQHQAQIRENIIKACQTDALLGVSTSTGHDQVQSLCATIGVTVP